MADPSHSSPTAAATGDALLPPPASDAPEAALPAAAADLDKEFEFEREELHKEKLAGTVGFHERHVFLCYKGPEEWPSHLEATESDRLPRLLAAAIKACKPNLKKSTKLIICEGENGTESSLGDVLIFPDMIRYRGLTHFDVDNFVEEVLVKDTEWLPGSPEPIRGSYIFVCCHGSRDKRCGVCGPALITRFKEEIEAEGLDGQVAVSACSHVGGHKYAGNVIIFGSDAKGEVTGHWYGYVAPDDVLELLHKHIGQGGGIVDRLWRIPKMDLSLDVKDAVGPVLRRRQHINQTHRRLAHGRILVPPTQEMKAASRAQKDARSREKDDMKKAVIASKAAARTASAAVKKEQTLRRKTAKKARWNAGKGGPVAIPPLVIEPAPVAIVPVAPAEEEEAEEFVGELEQEIGAGNAKAV